MNINGKIHLFFEQSGVFKNAFKNLGFEAQCYDIQDNFGETDHQIDLFHEFDTAYSGGDSIFDSINKDDLIMAFFPCIYFCENNQLALTYNHFNYRNLTVKEATDRILERSRSRERFYSLALKMFAIVKERGLRLIMENPWNGETFLKHFFVAPPTLVDKNRMLRGDYFTKPTAYWFVNCEPTYGCSFQNDKEKKRVSFSKAGAKAGICSEERSMISPDYARNFICDFILGQEQTYTQRDLFND